MSSSAVSASTASIRSWLDANPFVWNLIGACAFCLHDASGWRPWHYVLWTLLIAGAMEILAKLVLAGGMCCKRRIKDSAKPLMELDGKDVLFITINKVLTAAFTYHVIRYCWHSGLISWSLDSLNWLNTAVSLVLLYAHYDFWYYWFHRTLHIPAIYPLVHKHHHRQHSPFRGNADAINVHLFEFVTGEYNHLFSIHMVTLFLSQIPSWVASLTVSYPSAGKALASALPSLAVEGAYQLHLAAVAVFIIAGGVLASLNHTRFDVRLALGGYETRYHDIHHARNVRTNYSQYTMLWDKVFGTFLEYKEDAGAAAAVNDGEEVPSKSAGKKAKSS